MTKFIVLIALLLTSSCAKSPESDATTIWSTRQFNATNLIELDITQISKKSVSIIENDYQNFPAIASYPELRLSSAYIDRNSKKKFLIFDINYVEDIQVVYEVNQSGAIHDKYLLSSWN